MYYRLYLQQFNVLILLRIKRLKYKGFSTFNFDLGTASGKQRVREGQYLDRMTSSTNPTTG